MTRAVSTAENTDLSGYDIDVGEVLKVARVKLLRSRALNDWRWKGLIPKAQIWGIELREKMIAR